MLGLDAYLVGLVDGDGGVMLIAVAVLLGLRHATDPDHLTAVSAIVLDDPRAGLRRARTLGLAWGLGHAVTLIAFGLPIVLVGRSLPQGVLRAAEIAVGVLIVVLSARLLVRWRRGAFHTHVHVHGGAGHVHPHAHDQDHAPDTAHRNAPESGHDHPHAEALGRTPLAAFGIGLIHGIGGSGGFGVLVVAAASSRMQGTVALLAFAVATALSMTLITSAVGSALGRRPAERRLAAVIPVLAVMSLVFGLWYAVGVSGLVAS